MQLRLAQPALAAHQQKKRVCSQKTTKEAEHAEMKKVKMNEHFHINNVFFLFHINLKKKTDVTLYAPKTTHKFDEKFTPG
jgi:hypothetical protein